MPLSILNLYDLVDSESSGFLNDHGCRRFPYPRSCSSVPIRVSNVLLSSFDNHFPRLYLVIGILMLLAELRKELHDLQADRDRLAEEVNNLKKVHCASSGVFTLT